MKKENLAELINSISLSFFFEKELGCNLIKVKENQYKTKCVFHNEKTPSLYISDAKRTYHCFGCGEKGNILTLLKKTRNLNTREAIEYLKNQTNFQFNREFVLKNKKENIEPETIEIKQEYLKEVARLYRDKLRNDLKVNKKLYNYLVKERGLSEKIIYNFSLGYAPNYNILSEKYKNDNEKLEYFCKIGLLKKKGTKYYDVFKNRIIIPSVDDQKNITQLYGRIIDSGNKNNIKYLNLKIPLSNLYGDYWAKNSIKNKESIFLTEGQIDMISLFQSGLYNSLATVGSSISQNKIKEIKKYSPKRVYLCFDSDSTGVISALELGNILKKENIQCQYLFIEFDKNNKKKDINSLLKEKIDIISYIKNNLFTEEKFLEKVLTSNNFTIEEKSNIIERISKSQKWEENKKKYFEKKIENKGEEKDVFPSKNERYGNIKKFVSG